MQLLIADDQTEVRSALRFSLEQSFPELTIADVSQAAELDASLSNPDLKLVLLDWELPGMQDSRLLNRLLHGFKTIVLSATPTNRQRALTLGACDFVCKSDPPETILQAVGRLVPLEGIL